MKRNIIVLVLFTMFSMSCMADDVRSKAKELNIQIGALIQQINQTSDSLYRIDLIKKAVKAGVECDKYDATPKANGEIKLRYRTINKERLTPLRQNLLESAFYGGIVHRDLLDLYIVTSQSPLFPNIDDIGKLAYNASEKACYGTKDYATAEHFADIALQYSSSAKKAAEVKIICMKEKLKTHTDSARYIIALLELHDKAPENKKYFQMLMSYFTSSGHEDEISQFANDEIRKDSMNAIVWALRGETDMKRRDWKSAEEAYVHVLKIDSMMIEAQYNLGICYSSMALEKKDSLANLHDGRLLKSERVVVRKIFDKARLCFEKARISDPQEKRVKWSKPLYQVYYALGDKKSAKALDVSIINVKQDE